MPRIAIHIILTLLAAFVQGCIHTYPDPARAVDPAKIRLELELTPPAGWDTLMTHSSKAGAEPLRRIIVEMRGRDGHSEKMEFFRPASELSEPVPLSLPLDFMLDPTAYDLAIWSDFVDAASRDFKAFDASDLSDIRIRYDGNVWTPLKDCCSALKRVDLSEHKGKELVTVKVPVMLNRPVARFRLIPLDYEEFLKTNMEQIRKGETYYVEIDLEPGFPLSFDLTSYSTQIESDTTRLTFPLDIITIPGVEVELGSGYLFCDGRATLSARVKILNSAKAVVSRTQEFDIPIAAGKISIIKGDFMTSTISGGLTVDTTWEDEIIIPVGS
ncbi:MAG: hypothetical protein K1W02_14605 [Muribaculaceae bacterium]